MKTYLFLFVVFFFTSYSVFSQSVFTSVDSDREVIVQFKSDSYTLPSNKFSGTIDEFQFKSQSLRTLLQENNVEEISQLIPGFTQEDRVKISRTGEQVTISDWSNYFLLRMQTTQNREELINYLNNEEDVLLAEPNKQLQLFTIPDDEFFYRQWYLKNDGTSAQGNGTIGADIRAPEAWDITTGESDVKVAIVDWGIDSHTEFSSRLSGDPTSYAAHGTTIAGIIGATGNNSAGIAGIAWNVGLINADWGDEATGGTIYDAVLAIERAFNYGAYILNNSWGDPEYFTILRRVFADAYKLNIISIAFMGNDYQQQIQNYPAAFQQGMIAVGGTDNNDIVSPFSTIGNWIDVSAPGGHDWPPSEDDIYSTYVGNSYNYSFGTSNSGPIVAGISALMLSIDLPTTILDNDDVENIIECTAKDLPPTGFDIYSGWGRVDARNALDKLLLPYEINHYTTIGGSIYGSATHTSRIFYGVDGLIDGCEYHVDRYEVRKTVNFSSGPETKVWGRGFLTTGYSNENPNFGLGWTDVVSYNNNSAILRTYVYEVFNFLGWSIGWFPCQPSEVYLNYTTHQKTGVIPPGLTSITWSNNHPKPYWEASSDPKFDYYEVWKLKDGSWSMIATTTNLYYVDNSETRYGGSGQGTYVYYKIRAVDEYDQFSEYSNQVSAKVSVNGTEEKINVSQVDEMVVKFALENNYPNPFNPSTEISFGLPEDSFVTIKVFNVLGEEVKKILNKSLDAGKHKVSFDARHLSSGIYLYQLSAKSNETGSYFVDTKKMILSK